MGARARAGASIVVVEANSGTIPDLMVAVQTAAGIAGVSVVTMSWSGSESLYASPSYDSLFATPGITFVAASGDNGFFGGVQYPASSPNVLAVGGTTLQVDSSGNYLSETPWFGTSGGFSSIEPEPSFQASVQSTGSRSTPDVAFDGNPNTGVEVYEIDPYSGQGTWMTVAGTSLGAQAWGALIAVVDQGRAPGQPGNPRLRPDADRPLQPSFVRLPHRRRRIQPADGTGHAQRRQLHRRHGRLHPEYRTERPVATTPAPATPPVTGHKKSITRKSCPISWRSRRTRTTPRRPPPNTTPASPPSEGQIDIIINGPSNS